MVGISVFLSLIGAWWLIGALRSEESKAVRMVRGQLETQGLNVPSDLISTLVSSAYKELKEQCRTNPEFFHTAFAIHLAVLTSAIVHWSNGTSDDVSHISPEAYSLLERYLGKFEKSA